MKRPNQARRIVVATSCSYVLATALAIAGGQFASTVIDYQPGSPPSSLTNPYTAVGEPGPIVGASFGFDSVHSPFNPHFEATELCQIGEGGHLTLKLESGVAISPGAPEIAIFANVSLVDSRYPNGEHKSGTFGADPVVVDV